MQTWKMAWSAVCANKFRTFLTMLGIVIGVAALIVLVSIAGGASSSVSSQISDMGSDYLTVQITDDKENPLRLSEFSELFQDEFIGAAAPAGRTSVTAKSGYTSAGMTITGTTSSYFEIMGLDISSGRSLKKTDTDNASYVIVITADTAVELFGNTNAAGEMVSLDGKAFLVAGVLADDSSLTSASTVVTGSSQEETDSSDSASAVTLEGYIPYSTLSRMADNMLDITQFYVSSAGGDSMDQTQMAVQQIMLERFEDDEEAFSIQSQSEIMETMAEVNETMTLMIGGIAAISLLVGGIGIMNIMLVSVTERTKEIGIRKAIGAGRQMIMMQFLLEAFIVSMAGCLLGIVVSFGILKIAGIFMGASMEFSISPGVIWISVLFSGIIGIVFGLYPANKAAKKKPIDALRYSG
ncbi:Macrolide export ATP-binding/permease protein MacB [uncultured Roseburia sp.]|nr:Macrolide export ATP-binding/permease protein MacB [uncultured Roseburia sp.]